MGKQEEIKNLILGRKLRESREAVNLSLADIATITKIPVKYIEWLESGNYERVPADVYVKGFLARYAKILNLDKKILFELYVEESKRFSESKGKKNVVPVLKSHRFVITPKFIAVTMAIIVFASAFGYLIWQVYLMMKPPRIVLDTAKEDFVAAEDRQLLKGTILGANILTINEKTVNFNQNGEFNEEINLSEGLNVVEFKAENRFGKTTTVVRKIILNKN